MSRARCWKLQINLDTFNASFAALDTAEEKADFLTGLSRGMNGGKVKDDCSDPMSVGFAVGSDMRQEAEGFRLNASINGSKRKSNRNDHSVHQEVDQTVHHPGHPILNPISNNPISTNPPTEKEPSSSRARKSAGKKNEPLPIPEEFLPMLEAICKHWPRRTTYSGEQANVSLLSRPADLWARIKKFFPSEDPALMLKCALAYLDSLDERPKDFRGLVPNVCAMTNFYGEAEIWKKMIVKVQEQA